MTRSLPLLAAIASFLAAPLYADCVNPAGPEGEQMYNADYHVMQFCNGTNWVSMAASGMGTEVDPHVGTSTNGKWCSTDGAIINCTADEPGAASQWINSGSAIYYNVGNVGIGTATPGSTLDVGGPAKFGADSTTCTDVIKGRIRWNDSGSYYEFCNGTGWMSFMASGSGSSATCATPWSGTLNSGDSVLAYQAATVACGETCAVQVRSCNNGTLSGSYTHQSCSATACDLCVIPWGGSLAHGSSITAYSATSPAAACSTVAETRSCNNGTLSGSFTNQSCTSGCTGTPWGGVASGYSNTAYSSTAPASSCATAAQTRTCTNGTMSGSYVATSCTNGCTGTPWGDVPTGFSNTAYSSATPAAACSTVAETRTCTNGTLSGSYTATACNSGCTSTPWGAVAHGYSNTAYSSSTPAAACSTVAETRTCTNGSFSGSYTATTCANGCTGTPWGAVASGYSGTAYQVASGPTCPSETRSCTNGTLSGSYTYTSCTITDVCAGSPSPGTVCADGSVYAGLSPDGNVKMFTTVSDSGSGVVWDSANLDITGVSNCTSSGSCNAYGKANSAAIVALRGSAAAAAYLCENLTQNGKSDWYLPSLPELHVMYTNRSAIGNFNTSGSYYWSSSEYHSIYAWIESFSDGSQYDGIKDSYYRVRCARR